MIYKTCIGSEWHTTERRGFKVEVEDKLIWEAFKPLKKTEWHLVGSKGRHGKYAISYYDIPDGLTVVATATANGRPDKKVVFRSGAIVDFDGYFYSSEPAGWIVSKTIEELNNEDLLSL